MRGQLQFSLNWILVAVAGAFFLLLFIAIARNITETGQDSRELSSFNQVLRTIENAKSSPGTQVRASFSNLETTCESVYAVQLAGQIRNIPEHALYSPPLLDGALTIRSEELYLGFPIITLTYLLPDARPIYAMGSVDVNLREFLEAETITNTNDAPQDAILVSDQTILPEDAPSIVILIPSGPDNKVSFYENGVLTGESNYVNKELLLAAIASTNKERYECGLSIVEKKMRFLAKFNKERAEIIKSAASVRCNSAYDSAIRELETLEQTELTQITEINSVTRGLNRANSILLANSCPTI